jgi:hypothetical protein
MSKSIIGIVESNGDAEAILSDLHRIGFSAGDISVMLPGASASSGFRYRQRSKAPEGACLGACLGGLLGAAFGLVASLNGALSSHGGSIPSSAAWLAALNGSGNGLGFAALSGSAIGLAFGCALGALLGRKVPEIEARHYRGQLAHGNILIAVHVESRDAQRIGESVLTRGGAHDVCTAREAAVRDVR